MQKMPRGKKKTPKIRSNRGAAAATTTATKKIWYKQQLNIWQVMKT